MRRGMMVSKTRRLLTKRSNETQRRTWISLRMMSASPMGLPRALHSDFSRRLLELERRRCAATEVLSMEEGVERGVVEVGEKGVGAVDKVVEASRWHYFWSAFPRSASCITVSFQDCVWLLVSVSCDSSIVCFPSRYSRTACAGASP